MPKIFRLLKPATYIIFIFFMAFQLTKMLHTPERTFVDGNFTVPKKFIQLKICAQWLEIS